MLQKERRSWFFGLFTMGRMGPKSLYPPFWSIFPVKQWPQNQFSMAQLHSKHLKTSQNISICHLFHPERNLRKFWKSSKIDFFAMPTPSVKSPKITIFPLFEAAFQRDSDFKIGFRRLKHILNISKRLKTCQYITYFTPKVIWESFENPQKSDFWEPSTPGDNLPGSNVICWPRIYNSDSKYDLWSL